MRVIIYFSKTANGAKTRAAPSDLLPSGGGGGERAVPVLPFAFQYESNKAKRLLCNL